MNDAPNPLFSELLGGMQLGGFTYIILDSEFVGSGTTPLPVTGLSFVPEANGIYEVEGMLMVRTALATVAPRPGILWPTGMSDGVGFLQMSGGTGFGATTPRYGDPSASVILQTTDVANATGSFPCLLKATLVAGATPGSSFRVSLEAEVVGTNVSMRAGSYIKYRRIG